MRVAWLPAFAAVVLFGLIGCGGGEKAPESKMPANPPPATGAKPPAPPEAAPGAPAATPAGTEAPAAATPAPGAPAATEPPATPATPAATPAPAGMSQTAPAGLDLSLVIPKFHTAVVIHPARMVKSPLLAPILEQEEPKAMLQAMGIDLGKIERQMLLFPKMDQPQWAPLIVLQFSEPVNLKEMLTKVASVNAPPGAPVAFEEKMLPGGKTGFILPNTSKGTMMANPDMVAFMKDDRTMVAADDATLAELGTAAGQPCPLRDRLAKADLNADVVSVTVLEPIRGAIDQAIAAGKGNVPPELTDLTKIPNMLDAITATVDLSGGTLLKVDVNAKDEASAKEINNMAITALTLGKTVYNGYKEKMPAEAKQQMAPMLGLADKAIAGVDIKTVGTDVSVALKTPEGLAEMVPMFMMMAKEMGGGGMGPGMAPAPGGMAAPGMDQPAAVAPAEETIRIWTDASGTHKIEAKYTGFQDGKVQLEKADGSKMQVPLGSLSAPDQEYVKQKVTGGAPAPGPATPPM
jgi:hypothetical protein